LIASVQNIKILINAMKTKSKATAMAMCVLGDVSTALYAPFCHATKPEELGMAFS